MGFKFSLAAVLRLKQSIEKQEELALQKVLVEISQVQHRMEALTADILHARQLLEQAMREMLPAVLVESMTNRIEGAMDRKQELSHALAELSRQREIQLRKYQAARNNCQMLHDMHARQQDAHAREREHAEQKFLDEIFAARAQRS